jgi:hypothetical protein
MDGKLATIAAAWALATPFVPSSLGIEGWQKVGVFAAATALYIAARYFDLKMPERSKETDALRLEIKELKEKISLISVKVGLNR